MAFDQMWKQRKQLSQAYITGDFGQIFLYSEMWVSVYETHCGHPALLLDRRFVPVHLPIVNTFCRGSVRTAEIFSTICIIKHDALLNSFGCLSMTAL